MFVVALIYAANFSIAKPVMAGDQPYVTPFAFIMMRVIAATTLLWITHFIFIRESVAFKDIQRMAICAIFGVAGNQLTFFYGLNMTTPINGALIMLTTPILVIILSVLFFGKKINLLKILGVMIGLAGAAMLCLNQSGDMPNAPDPLMGNIFIGINATFYALYLLLVKPLMSKYSPITTLKWVFFFGMCYVTPFGFSEMVHTEWHRIPTDIYYSIFFVLFFVTYMAYLLNGAALSVVDASVSSSYIYLQPLLASIIAISLGMDVLTSTMILAGIMIFAGVFMVSKN